jgi:tRNA G10  N-methylase Trm11
VAKKVLEPTSEKKTLEEILVRVKALQDALEENEIEAILRDPKYGRALREVEGDIKSARERPLHSFVKDLSRRT